jgi:uncharacterized membrane protein YkvI
VTAAPSLFKRIVLPGLAFKAIIIGGGYATGRELAEYFMPNGPRGGLAAMALSMASWSAVCVGTFLFARAVGARDYRTFFKTLLGPFWRVFELVYVLFVILILSVFGAAAGAIGAALFGWPRLIGTLCLMATIALITAFGNASVERLFKWVSIFLYATYIVFVVLVIGKFGGGIATSFATTTVSAHGWIMDGFEYAGYNVFGAVAILAVVRQMTSTRDAVVAGLLAGPLAIIPAVLFFICMCAFYPQIGAQTLPSDFLLQRLDLPAFRFAFQFMVFLALLESGTGVVHAINERIAAARHASRGLSLPKAARFAIAMGLLVSSIFIADRVGLVTLIAEGYRGLAYTTLVIYVLPLMTYGVWRLLTSQARDSSWKRRACGPHG